VLYERLGGRSSDRPDAIRRRLRRAHEEVEAAIDYDYIVVNDDRTQAVSEVAAIIDAERRRAHRFPDLATTLTTLRQGLARIADRLASD
jgi:guanylate kinase